MFLVSNCLGPFHGVTVLVIRSSNWKVNKYGFGIDAVSHSLRFSQCPT